MLWIRGGARREGAAGASFFSSRGGKVEGTVVISTFGRGSEATREEELDDMTHESTTNEEWRR